MIDDVLEITTGKIEVKKGESYTASIFFDYIEEETKTGQANITDNYVEANYAIQDHIALTPKTYRLKGYVGEMTYRSPDDFITSLTESFNKKAKNSDTLKKLSQIYSVGNALSPVVSSYTQTAKNVINLVNDSYDRYNKIINNIKGNKNELENKKQNVCNSILFHLMDTRTPLNLEGLRFERTIGKDYKSQYFIQSVQSHQGDSRYMSDFEIILKELRTVESQTTKIDEKQLKEANAVQTTNTANNGKATTQKVKNMSTWDDRPKNMSTWSDKPKNMSTWSDRPKNVVPSFTSNVKKELK